MNVVKLEITVAIQFDLMAMGEVIKAALDLDPVRSRTPMTACLMGE